MVIGYYYVLNMVDITPMLTLGLTAIALIGAPVSYVLIDKHRHINKYADFHIKEMQEVIDKENKKREGIIASMINTEITHKKMAEAEYIRERLDTAYAFKQELSEEIDIFHPAITAVVISAISAFLALAFIFATATATSFPYQSAWVVAIGIICILPAYYNGKKSFDNFNRINRIIKVVNAIRNGTPEITEVIYKLYFR
jgi:Na+/glutamate symporter